MKKLSANQIVEIRKKHFLPAVPLYYSEPLHLVRASGCVVFDDQGREYLDGIGGIVCISAGHNHPKIKKALQEMLERDQIQHTSVLYLSQPAAELVEELSRLAPENCDRIHLTNSGSEANEVALAAVRHATGENMVINLRHSYHGGTAGALANCGNYAWRFHSQPVAGTASAVEPYCYRCPFGQKRGSCNLECAKNVEATIQTSTGGRIAGLIAEPIMGVGGFISPPREYFTEVFRIVKKYGGKYISDEVQTGVGRCGEQFFMTADLELDADAITMAKGLGNGAAIGAVKMKSDLAEPMTGKVLFHTFGSDPYQTQQALTTLQIVRDEELIENAKAMGSLLQEGLRQIKSQWIGEVRGHGLLVGLELVKDQKSKAAASEATVQFMELCKQNGLLVGKGGLLGNVIRFAPPMVIQRHQIEAIVRIVEKSLGQLGS